MTRLVPFLALVLAIAAGACRAVPTADLSARLDAAMEEALGARQIPGAALVVVRDGQVIHQRGYGVADLVTGRPVTDSTPFVIGSTSKALTAMTVLRMVAAGRLALDTPIVRYAPELHFADPRGGTITLRHLLTNRSGMVVGYSGPAFATPPVHDADALEREMRRAVALPLLFTPGQGYAYSNRGWALAGYVVQRVAGAPIEEVMARELFEPLGMRGTTLAFWTVPDLAQGYREGRTRRNIAAPASLTRAYGPAGMVVSTNRDVGRLLAMLLPGGRGAPGGAVLPPELVTEMFRPQADAEAELGGPTRYGLGWEIDSTFGTLTIKKAGSVGTMVSLWVLLPELRTGFGLLFNREDYRVLPLVANLVRILSGGEAEPFPAESPPAWTPPAAVPMTPGAARRWAGEYDTRYGELVVTLRSDSLVARMEGLDVGLAAASDSTFTVITDVVSLAGRTLGFRRQGGRVTAWLDGDSLGIRTDPR